MKAWSRLGEYSIVSTTVALETFNAHVRGAIQRHSFCQVHQRHGLAGVMIYKIWTAADARSAREQRGTAEAGSGIV